MLRFGHRGACGHAPENTLLSMRKALEFGVHGFEFDIQLSREGEPVIIHDATLERTTNGRGNVCDFSVRQLQAFDAGRGERIPTLHDALALVDRRCQLLVELKAESSAEPVADIITHYVQKKGWDYRHFHLCSFNHFQIDAVRRINPQIQTCALMACVPISLAAMATQARAQAINPCIHHISKALVDDAHARNLAVYAWTVNHPHDIEKARALGVDGIISDFPDRL
jgi:glycerophosphoryl diester phosphodiesterase